jgi:hypothetical protein
VTEEIDVYKRDREREREVNGMILQPDNKVKGID